MTKKIMICFVLVVSFLISSALFVNATPPTEIVDPIYDTKADFDSKEEVRDYFYSNFEKIREATENKYPGFESGQIEGIPQAREFTQSLIVVEDSDLERYFGKIASRTPVKYVVFIPIVKEGQNVLIKDNWIYKKIKDCKDPSEIISIDTKTGEEHCYGSGITEKEIPVYGVRFFVDNEGKILYAHIGQPNINNFSIGELSSSSSIYELIAWILVIGITIIIGLFFYFKKNKRIISYREKEVI